jgi:hypothetical protein
MPVTSEWWVVAPFGLIIFGVLGGVVEIRLSDRAEQRRRARRE